jgi:hypothetical protein
MGILLNDVFGEGVIGLRFEPSLSLRNTSHPPFRAASAFLLQAFAQSRVVVGSVSYVTPRMEGRIACCR